MEWLDPWWPTDDMTTHFHETFVRQLRREVAPTHEMYGLPARVIARGNGDDALFEILDGTGRVAVVHLVWSQGRQMPPWPDTWMYPSLQAFVDERMQPEHQAWVADGD